MGLCKVKYEDIEEHPEVYGDVLPKWAVELSGKGYKGVSAIDFYDDIFMDDLAEKSLPEDYKTGEYSAIAVEKVVRIDKDGNEVLDDDGKRQYRGRRTTITQGNTELYDLIERSDNFCLLAPISYAGRSRENKNARYMYALCIEVDDIQVKGGLNELIYSWERKNQPVPKPTYIVCSGNGLHLYYVFERPIPMWQNVFEAVGEYKKYLTPRLWTKYISSAYNNIQYESINQPFRIVGTRTKKGGYALAFEVGEKVTIEYMNQFVPPEKALDNIYRAKHTLQEAKELYPEWYKRRIEEGKPRGHWSRHEGIYYNWIDKMYNRAVVGKRYNCLENLCSLAVQCQIPPEQVKKDCEELAEYLESLTIDDNNHFTRYDIVCALKTYQEGKEQAYRRKIEYISNKTGIKLEPNKRRAKPLKRDDGTAFKAARAIQDLQYPNGEWRNKEGRPKKAEAVREWKEAHPKGTKAQCHRDTGISRPTIDRWWNV